MGDVYVESGIYKHFDHDNFNDRFAEMDKQFEKKWKEMDSDFAKSSQDRFSSFARTSHNDFSDLKCTGSYSINFNIT